MRSHRFFLNQSVPEVIELILREHQIQGWEFEFHLQHKYPKREQINQINESDWQFIERLLSEMGIFYSFSLQADTKTEIIHFGDSQRAYVYDLQLPLNSPSGMNDNGVESVWGCHYVTKWLSEVSPPKIITIAKPCKFYSLLKQI